MKYVSDSLELQRILALPRRSTSDATIAEYKRTLNAIYSYGREGVSLLDTQATALTEMRQYGGAACPIQVGGGKTLISFLAPAALESLRPILLLPAHLMVRTREELLEYAQNWRIPKFIRLESYQQLGHSNSDGLLEKYRPDLIIADEAHYLKNPKAECTFQVGRYMKTHPATRMVVLSGTITKRSLTDYAHLLQWSMGDRAPLPLEKGVLLEWAEALDEKVNPTSRLHPGALRQLCDPAELQAFDADPITATRSGFRRRLRDTPGYIATDKAGLPGCKLNVRTVEVETTANTEWAMGLLRSQEITPDGWQITDAPSLWRHAREIAVGFYRIWNPRPPEWWVLPRQEWAKACRQLTKYSQNYRKEGQIKLALRHGDLEQMRPVWEAWSRVEKQFKPNPDAVWLDDSVVNYCANWGANHKGVIWTEQTPFAMRLAARSGMPYYGKEGKDAKTGRQIESEKGDRSIIASIHSNGTGRNLQFAFDECLYSSVLPNGMMLEQSMGRFHRLGHRSDHVNVEIIVSSVEHVLAIDQAITDCTYYKQTQGVEQKILIADTDLLSIEDVVGRIGPLWDKTTTEQGMQLNE